MDRRYGGMPDAFLAYAQSLRDNHLDDLVRDAKCPMDGVRCANAARNCHPCLRVRREFCALVQYRQCGFRSLGVNRRGVPTPIGTIRNYSPRVREITLRHTFPLMPDVDKKMLFVPILILLPSGSLSSFATQSALGCLSGISAQRSRSGGKPTWCGHGGTDALGPKRDLNRRETSRAGQTRINRCVLILTWIKQVAAARNTLIGEGSMGLRNEESRKHGFREASQ
jgi:hypothetical protein